MVVRWQKPLLILIFFLGFFLRLHNLGAYPVKGETLDEYYWTFLGTSLIQEQKPTSWSLFDYPNSISRKIDGLNFQIVSPNVDLPPLFSFIPGIWQTIFGRSWDNPLSIFMLRLPMIALGMINLFLVYLVSRKNFSSIWVVVATAIYALTPTIILGSRLIVSDNLLITWMLALLVFVFYEKRSKGVNFLIALVCALCLLTKITGLALAGAFVLNSLLMKTKDWKPAVLGIIAGGALLFGYACVVGLPTFISVQLQQSSLRSVGFATLALEFFMKPKIVNTVFLDGIILAGTLTLFAISFFSGIEKKFKTIVVFAVCYIVFLCFTAGETTQLFSGAVNGTSLYGWYKFPLFPLLIFSLVFVLIEIYESFNKLGLIIVTFLFALQLRLFLFHAFDFQFELGLPKIIVRGTMLVLFLSAFLPKKQWKYCFWVILLAALGFSSLTVFYLAPTKVFKDAFYLLNF